jgi:hypothetical protein
MQCPAPDRSKAGDQGDSLFEDIRVDERIYVAAAAAEPS